MSEVTFMSILKLVISVIYYVLMSVPWLILVVLILGDVKTRLFKDKDTMTIKETRLKQIIFVGISVGVVALVTYMALVLYPLIEASLPYFYSILVF